MKIKTVCFLVCVLLTLPIQVTAERMTDNWKLTGYTKHRDGVFADMSRLSSPNPGITAVWLKIAPSSRSRYLQAIFEYLQSVKKQDQGFKSIEILCDVDCATHQIRFMQFVYLDNNRKIIHETYEGRPAWMQINPGGIWYPVEKNVCTENK